MSAHFHYPAARVFGNCPACHPTWEQEGQRGGQIWEWTQLGQRTVISDGTRYGEEPWYANPTLACEHCGLHLECLCPGYGERPIRPLTRVWTTIGLLLSTLTALWAWWETLPS